MSSAQALVLGDGALQYGASPLIGQHGAAVLETSVSASIKQPHFDFGWHPFDEQEVRVSVGISSANVTTCGSDAMFDGSEAVEEWYDKLVNLLTTENGWEINGPMRSSYTNAGRVDRCTIIIPIRRLASPYIFQNVIPSTLVCIASLLALLLNSESADTTAGRTSVLLVAMLLLVEKGGSDRMDSPSLM